MKRILIACFLILITASGFGQEEELSLEKKTRFGITFGLNSNSYKVDGQFNLVPTSLYGGLFVETTLSKKLSLRGEVLYSRIQSEDFNLFEAPIILKYKLGKKLSVFGGPQLNYMYNDREDPDFARKIDQRLTLGVNIGLEYQLTEKLSVDVRYTYRFTNQLGIGLTNINGFRIGVAYRF